MELKEAQKLYETAKTYWGENYDLAKDDLRFLLGDGHWDEKTKKAREAKNRPCLVIPQLPQFVHQVANDMRQNTPSINVLPVGEGSDQETAKTLKGLIRNIEYESGADEVYDTAGEYAVKCGLGFIRVDHDYESSESFNQKLYIKRVQNPLALYIDPNSTECDGSDAEWAIALDTIGKDAFEKAYPQAKFISFDAQEPVESKEETITIAELFYKKYTDITKTMQDGQMVEFIPSGDKEKDKAAKTRKIRKVTIYRCKLNGEGVLEETTFPGKYIPIVPVYGEEVWVDGKRVLQGLIRQAKDAQRRYNYLASKEAETVAIAPMAPFMAAAGQVDDFLDDWTDPDNSTVLQYKQTDVDGNPAPPPIRQMPPAMSTAIANAMQGTKEDIRASMGMYEASLGKRSNETSGVAIAQRKQEGDVATFHYADNRNRAIMQVGRILVNAIPEIYDTAQIIRIIGDEDEPQMVGINGQMAENQKQPFDLTQGKYDVRITTGPSYTTKRQEASNFMLEMYRANPALMNVAGDLMMKYMDVPGADALAHRLKKTIPPELLAGEDDNQDPRLMQMEAALQKMQGEMQALMGELQSKRVEEQAKMGELQYKNRALDLEMARFAADYEQRQQKQQVDAGFKDREVTVKEDEQALKVWQAERQAMLDGVRAIVENSLAQFKAGSPAMPSN